MPIQPRTVDEIYESVQRDLQNNIVAVTNFVRGSFNDQFLESHAEQVREAELKALSGELAGLVEYAGAELTDEDLNRLGIENVEPEEINRYQSDEHLENLAMNFSVTRDPGKRATGEVTISVSDDSIEIEEGFRVATPPDRSGNTRVFRVDADGDGEIDPDSDATVSAGPNEESVTVDVVADEPGSEYNVGPGSITHIPNPTPGIQGVTNPIQTDGGESEQSLDSLREDIQAALIDSSDGGTRGGLISGVEDGATEEIHSITIQEFSDESPPFVEVLVDGGDRAELEALVDQKKPVGIRHDVVRPTRVGLGVQVGVIGEGADEEFIASIINGYFDSFDIAENMYRSDLITLILEADANVISAPIQNIYYDDVDSERHTLDPTSRVYRLRNGPIGLVSGEQHYVGFGRNEFELMYSDVRSSSVEVRAVLNGTRTILDSDQFSVVDATGQSGNDTVVVDADVTEGTILEIDYKHESGSIDEVRTVDGEVFEEGIDWTPHDDDGDGHIDSIIWSTENNHPSSGERFEVDYRPRTSVAGDVASRIDERYYTDDVEDVGISVHEEVTRDGV